jgi:cytidine deaminase
MGKKTIELTYDVFQDDSQLDPQDAFLLNKARECTSQAYAPYSKFYVGAAALLSNDEIITGTNQENASFPAGICAEQVTLAAISSLHPVSGAIKVMAISYQGEGIKSDHPISPCGICRQALVEHEIRTHQQMRIILSGLSGEVFVIPNAQALLPLAFSPTELPGQK